MEKVAGLLVFWGREKSPKREKVAGLLAPAPKKLKWAFSERDWAIDHLVVTVEFALRNQYRQTGEERQRASPSPRPVTFALFCSFFLFLAPEPGAQRLFSIFATFRADRYLRTWVPGYPVTQVPGYLVTRVPGYLGTRAPGSWVPGYLGTRVPGDPGTQVAG